MKTLALVGELSGQERKPTTKVHKGNHKGTRS